MILDLALYVARLLNAHATLRVRSLASPVLYWLSPEWFPVLTDLLQATVRANGRPKSDRVWRALVRGCWRAKRRLTMVAGGSVQGTTSLASVSECVAGP